MSNKFHDPLAEANDKTFRSIAVALGILAYFTVVVLTGAHSYNLIVSAVAENVRWIAVFGFIGLEINAIALPLAIHYWTRSPAHRMAAISFYVFDILLLYLNSTVDASIVTGAVLPVWGNWYLLNVAQVSPIFTMVIWAVLFVLDPTQVAKEKVNMMIAQAQTNALSSTMDYLNSDEYLEVIKSRGEEIGDFVISQAFETSAVKPKRKKARSTNGGVRDFL